MERINLQNLHFAFREEELFQTGKLTIKDGEVIGIIGRNGSGKSTLLRLIMGELTPERGTITHFRPSVFYHVRQEVEEYAFAYSPLHQKWQLPDLPYSQLSGGQQLKARLLDGFESQADILLLDEPTNHLDEASQDQLVEAIQTFPGTVLVVSHDRHFLDRTATKIWAIEQGQVAEVVGNYSHYANVREHRRLTQRQAYEKQQREISRIEQEIAQLGNWSQKAHRDSTSTKHEKMAGSKEYYRLSAKRMDRQVKSRRKRLEKELAEHQVERLAAEPEVYFEVKANSKRGKRILRCEGVHKSYGSKPVLRGVSFQCTFGDRIALTGANGSGKTTLVKAILGEPIDRGAIWLSPSAKVGYLSQAVFDLPDEKTPSQLFQQETFAEQGKVRTMMVLLGFNPEQWRQPVASFSMGERVKLKLMQFLLAETDLLILDEPTNHMDLETREELERTLAAYTGTLLVISHDRYFRERVTEEELELIGGQLRAKREIARADDTAARLMQLETELQFVLGKLSLKTAKDAEYLELDERFRELTRQIRAIKQQK